MSTAESDLDNHVRETGFRLGRSQNSSPERDGFVLLEEVGIGNQASEDNDQRNSDQGENAQINAVET